MEELKAATFAAHARLQGAPFFATLAACQLPLESYVGQLRALLLIHGVLEHALASCGDEQVMSVWNGDMRKTHLLQQDLSYFEPRTVADLKEAVAAALQADQAIRLWSIEQPLCLLGCVYVLEGSTLGAAVLRPLVARALLLADEGQSYLNNYGPAVHARWSQFKQRMNALELKAEQREEIVNAAKEFFGQLETIFLALYPFQPESKTFLVTSINPEAGRHALPADPREVQAALRAGDMCWQRFPYYEQRYGERGRRFARSDAAWQATLYRYPPAQILQQVRWLGRVLAGRGMPTCLLQVQLEILVNELSATVPERTTDYQKLLLGADVLLGSRRKHLSDPQLDAIKSAFDQAVGPDLSARLPQIGALLGCAVADELEGSVGAVQSLQTWLGDETRFPAEWIAAVKAALAQARMLAGTAAITGSQARHEE
jgi:heme oxygenase